jgi:putative holliday junction resolvase
MRILGLDVGDKKIGISMSDSTGIIAQGLKLYRREVLRKDMAELKKIVDGYEVQEIVIGLPRDLSGEMGKKAQEITTFSDEVRKHFALPVVLWDERFSTNEAHRVFEMANVSHKKRRPFLDVMASQLILQGYLDARKTA